MPTAQYLAWEAIGQRRREMERYLAHRYPEATLEDREDVVGEALLAIHKHLPVENAWLYLLAACTRHMVTQWRRQQRWTRKAQRWQVQAQRLEEDRALDIAQGGNAAHDTATLLGQLRVRPRSRLMQSLTEEAAQVAHETQCTVEALQQDVRRSRQRLTAYWHTQ
jgi:hypothetical protein